MDPSILAELMKIEGNNVCAECGLPGNCFLLNLFFYNVIITIMDLKNII